MGRKTAGKPSGVVGSVAETGLERGAVAKIAAAVGCSEVYVWKVATGRKLGSTAIRRRLLEAGWRDPRRDEPRCPTCGSLTSRRLLPQERAACVGI